MAEIHVEPKKQTTGTLWIWIVVVLVIAALTYFLVTRNQANNNNNNTTAPANTTGAIVLPLSAMDNAAVG